MSDTFEAWTTAELRPRLVDELRIQLSPLVLGGGTRLFALVGPTTLIQPAVTESPRATHLTMTWSGIRPPAWAAVGADCLLAQ